jgi:hypothetical protein
MDQFVRDLITSFVSAGLVALMSTGVVLTYATTRNIQPWLCGGRLQRGLHLLRAEHGRWLAVVGGGGLCDRGGVPVGRTHTRRGNFQAAGRSLGDGADRGYRGRSAGLARTVHLCGAGWNRRLPLEHSAGLDDPASSGAWTPTRQGIPSSEWGGHHIGPDHCSRGGNCLYRRAYDLS